MGNAPAGSSVTPLEDKYFVQKVKLGQGSFGTVWRAVNRQSGETVAIKQLDKAGMPRRGVTRQDIDREVSVTRACQHVNIIALYDTFEDSNSIYIALEYCDGGDFGDKVRERGMGMEEQEAADWMRQICAALRALHANSICHRDIKPDNFMVRGNPVTLKLSDFGLAVFLPRGKMLQEKCGTPAFMAPEQHNLPSRSSGYGFPCDIWAVGVSMYMVMFGGKHPFLNDRGHLDDNLLLAGELDFRDTNKYTGFFGFGGVGMRFSEEARHFCKRMVEPDQQRRVTAEDSVGCAWLTTGVQPTPPPVQEAPPPVRGPPTPPPPSARRQHTPPRHGPDGADARAVQQRALSARPIAAEPSVEVDYLPVPMPQLPRNLSRNDQISQEAAKLKDENAKLQDELVARRTREEELVLQQRQLQEQQKVLQHQRHKELLLQNEKLLQREKQLQQIQQEKQELERQRAKSVAPPVAPSQTQDDAAKPPGLHRSRSEQRHARATSPVRTGLLRRGQKCRYLSSTYGWMTAVVQAYNDADGTYNLDVRQHAALDAIAPTSGVGAAEAWPPGTLTAYHSSTVNRWLPSVVVSYNEGDSTYNLDVRDHADIDRIRARADKPDEDAPAQKVRGQYADPQQTVVDAPAKQRTRQDVRAKSPLTVPDQRDRASRAPLRVGDYRAPPDLDPTSTASVVPSGTTPSGQRPRFLQVGDRCRIPEHGLVVVESCDAGNYTVAFGRKQRMQVQADIIRAPDDVKYAWPAGMKVLYQSSSVGGKWIDANVVSFNSANSTYNLDVRLEAAPDKVRPRS